MIFTAVTGLIMMQTRMMREVFSEGVREVWNKWELRALVFISLTCQILLIVLGNRRKCIHRIWIKAVVWSAYLLADSVATIALGVLLNDLGKIYNHGGRVDSDTELTAFWAPFFLLHLGGPDTITAYTIEDNELFLRHAFQLIFQTGATILILLTAWNGSKPSILTIPMICVGIIKYGEKTVALFSASSNRLRDSMLSPPEAGPNYQRFMEEYCLKYEEGYMLKTVEMKDETVVKIVTPAEPPKEFTSGDKIKHGHDFFQLFKRLLADLILSNQERKASLSLLKKMYNFPEVAFDVIAIELGFMYDLLYTKATIINTRWGLLRRLFTTLATCAVGVVFVYENKDKYVKVDIYITYLLLGVAIALETYAALVLLFSDQSTNRFNDHKKNVSQQSIILLVLKFLKPFFWVLRFLKPFFWVLRFLKPIFKPSRWSNRIGEYSFMRQCLDKVPFYYRLLELLHVDKLCKKYRYKSSKPMPGDLKKSIFEHLKRKLEAKENNVRDFNTRGSGVLERYNQLNILVSSLKWSFQDVEFDQSILIWHIATELCYSETKGQDIPSDLFKRNSETSRDISQYMMHLLVMYPFLLPVGIGYIRLRDTLCETKIFLEERKFFDVDEDKKNEDKKNEDKQNEDKKNEDKKNEDKKNEDEKNEDKAWKILLEVKPYVEPIKVKGDRSKSVLFDACRIASEINKINDHKKKWELISDVWLEMLTYAASEGKGSDHGRHLRQGGELLTHVWLLMAHFGMTEQFQISKGHARARLETE